MFFSSCEKAVWPLVWHTHHAHMPREGRMMGDALAERSLRIEEVVDTAACVASRGTKCAFVEPSCASTSFHVHRHSTYQSTACSLHRRGSSDLRRVVASRAAEQSRQRCCCSSEQQQQRTTDEIVLLLVPVQADLVRPPRSCQLVPVAPHAATGL